MDRYVYFRIDSMDQLQRVPANDVRELDWHDDIAIIREFYANWTNDLIDPDENDETVGNPLVVLRNNKIVSFAVPFSFCDGELEIGAVATVPAYQNRGHCKAIISELACRIMERGMAATLTTRKENIPMQAAAKAIGMRQVVKG